MLTEEVILLVPCMCPFASLSVCLPALSELNSKEQRRVKVFVCVLNNHADMVDRVLIYKSPGRPVQCVRKHGRQTQ